MNEQSQELEKQLGKLGWTLAFAGVSRGDPCFTATKAFPGSPVPITQASATAHGLLRAVAAYDRHRAGDKPGHKPGDSPAASITLPPTPVSTGLSSTHNYR